MVFIQTDACRRASDTPAQNVPHPAQPNSTHAHALRTLYHSPATVRPPPNARFSFVTSWVLFLEGLSGISGLAVSYFYKNTLKVDPATLTQVMSLTP